MTVDVAVNAEHTSVDLNLEDVPAEHHPVRICLGDTLLYDEADSVSSYAPVAALAAEYPHDVGDYADVQ